MMNKQNLKAICKFESILYRKGFQIYLHCIFNKAKKTDGKVKMKYHKESYIQGHLIRFPPR